MWDVGVVAFALAMTAAPTPSSDWTGRYVAEETAGPNMVMSYSVDVFRGPEGDWRALVAVDGHMTFRRLVARGQDKGGALLLRFVRSRSDDMSHASVRYPADEPILTIVPRGRAAFTLRFGSEGSYLNNAATLPAARRSIPLWAGHYVYRHCAAQGDCSSWTIDVSLAEEGWMGQVRVDGSGRAEHVQGRGEEGEEVGLGKYLRLLFVDAESAQAGYQVDAELLKLVEARDGSVRLRFGKLAGPTGIAEAKVEVRRER